MEKFKIWWNLNREKVIPRLKSLLWRAGCMGAIAGINSLTEQISGLGFSATTVTLIGLVLGEVTKWLNAHTNLFGGKQKQ